MRLRNLCTCTVQMIVNSPFFHYVSTPEDRTKIQQKLSVYRVLPVTRIFCLPADGISHAYLLCKKKFSILFLESYSLYNPINFSRLIFWLPHCKFTPLPWIHKSVTPFWPWPAVDFPILFFALLHVTCVPYLVLRENSFLSCL